MFCDKMLYFQRYCKPYQDGKHPKLKIKIFHSIEHLASFAGEIGQIDYKHFIK